MRLLGARPVVVIVLAGLAAAALACGSATDRIRGGESRFDAAEPTGTSDASGADTAPRDAAPGDAAPDADAAAPDATTDAARDAARG